MKTICIMCPIGCELIVETKGDIKVSGNMCPRGEQYGKDEATCPRRIVTSIVRCEKDYYCSVKTTRPVPKTKINEILGEISKIPAKKREFGEILIKNVAGTDADIVVTGT